MITTGTAGSLINILLVALSCRNKPHASAEAPTPSEKPKKKFRILQEKNRPPSLPESETPVKPLETPSSAQGQFELIGLFAQMVFGKAMESGDMEKAKLVFKQVLINWEVRQNARTKWTKSELAADLGVCNEFVSSVVRKAVEEGTISDPGNQLTKSAIEAVLEAGRIKIGL